MAGARAPALSLGLGLAGDVGRPDSRDGHAPERRQHSAAADAREHGNRMLECQLAPTTATGLVLHGKSTEKEEHVSGPVLVPLPSSP
jgi:hypothetical protein